MISTLEDLSLNAWPSHQTLLYDGWILRFANGYTKRANSVNPVYSSKLDLDEKITFCEHIYRGKKLDVVFKLTAAASPANLDEVLSARGYQLDSPTSVQILELRSAEISLSPGVHFHDDLSAEWLDAFCRMSSLGGQRRESLQQILLNIIPRRCFVSFIRSGQILAAGLGVLQSGYIGLFDIVVDKEWRNQGYGRQIVESILHWGRQNGAQHSYLQVMLNNPHALHLYSKIGFVEEYQYWYRVKP